MITSDKGIKFDLEWFKKGEFAVNCETQEEAKAFLQYLDGKGMKWMAGVDLTTYTNWNVYKKDTYYTNDRGLMFGCIQGMDGVILKYSELDFSERKKTNFERIKKMTIEEMVELLDEIDSCHYCVFDGDCTGHEDCLSGYRQWLESEADDE